MTAKLSPTDNLRKEESVRTTTANPPPASQSSEALKQVTRATPSEARDGAVLTDKDTAKELDEKKSIERRQVSVGAAAPPMVLQPGLPGNSIHGMMAARAKSAPVGGPMAANQFQQQSVAEQQNALQSQSAQFDATNSPVIAGSVPAAASQTVTVQPKAEVSAPAPAQPAPLDLIPMTGQSYSLSSVSSCRRSARPREYRCPPVSELFPWHGAEAAPSRSTRQERFSRVKTPASTGNRFICSGPGMQCLSAPGQRAHRPTRCKLRRPRGSN